MTPHRLALTLACVLFAFPPAAGAAPQNADSQAADIVQQSEVHGGLIVHLGIGDGSLTSALRVTESYQVHGLDTDAGTVDACRRQLHGAGVYGDVSVDQFDGRQLPYVDNLINLLVAEDLGDVSMDEVLRVLCPNGVAMIRTDGEWKQTVKPRPDNIDEWTHYLHDASGNAVAHDTVVGPPKHLQWVGSPRWSRHHDRMASMSALVSAGGRIYYIMDEGSRVSIQLPSRWSLVARDAFNGTILWKRPLDDWQNHLWPLKSGPTQLARRLVAIDDKVYVTLGYRAAIQEIDGATGETLHTFEESNPTEELVVHNGVLYALVNHDAGELDNFAPEFNTGDQGRVAREYAWNEKARELIAYDLGSHSTLWRKGSKVAPLTLSADDNSAFIHDGEKVVALDRYTGEEIWSTPPVTRRSKLTMNFGPKLVVQDGVLLFAGGDRKMAAFDTASGESLWESPHAQSGYQSPEDVLVVNGLVWNAPTTKSNDTGTFTARDVRSGEVKAEFSPDVDTYWFHHRCYIAKATDRFLMPSRTGIEFVDPGEEHWNINHWVRGGCLYGVMPCNGLTYAPPHNCACYPEAKLYGLNALAPASANRELPETIDESTRLQRGPAFAEIEETAATASDWPTYRHDRSRSGFTTSEISAELNPSWEAEPGGRLSSVVVANGTLYVAQIDQHTLHALDASTGENRWSFTAGGRVDSPPTAWKGRVFFGSADGWVYCLRATDGELAWRFRGAPVDRRVTAFEQLESVWPVHGSVLVDEGSVYCVAGRSNFLDGGLRWLKLDAITGEKQVEEIIDEKNPDGPGTLQDKLEILQMAVGLPDVLSSDDNYVYMRSQRFNRDGKRFEVGPNSGDFAGQASVHHGEGPHLFAPMGFLDDTWFHRSYWVFGKSFAGGHAGYYQAGKFAPSGRILVNDEDNVYGFGRKPEYLKWTTIIEHQLFSAPREAPVVDERLRRRGQGGAAAASMIRFENTESIDPTSKPIAVEAWVNAEKPGGVIVAHGGPSQGYALVIAAGKPRFILRADSVETTVAARGNIVGKWTHLVGQVTADRTLQLFVNGKLASTETVPRLITATPAQSLQIGADEGSAVGSYKSPNGFSGLIDNVRVYHGSLSAGEVAAQFTSPGDAEPAAPAVVAVSFDRSDTTDESGNNNHGIASRTRAMRGHIGMAMRFQGRVGGNQQPSSTFVKPHWTQDVPLLVRGMLKSNDTLFIVGPPDIIDEEATFKQLVLRDPAVDELLAAQDAILRGEQGSVLRAISAKDGSTLSETKLSSLPVWDSLAAADNSLYLTTTDGKVVSLKSK